MDGFAPSMLTVLGVVQIIVGILALGKNRIQLIARDPTEYYKVASLGQHLPTQQVVAGMLTPWGIMRSAAGTGGLC